MTPRQQLDEFLDRYEPPIAKLTRAALQKMRARRNYRSIRNRNRESSLNRFRKSNDPGGRDDFTLTAPAW